MKTVGCIYDHIICELALEIVFLVSIVIVIYDFSGQLQEQAYRRFQTAV